MKRILTIILFSALAVIAAFSLPLNMNSSDNSHPDWRGHVLTSLWNEYYSFNKADKPANSLAVLENIREQAAARRLHYDFYDAATSVVEVASRINWKDVDSLEADLERRISEYDEPIVTYSHLLRKGSGSRLDFVLSNESRLRAGRNPAFYSIPDLPDTQVSLFYRNDVKNDFEYCLWMEFAETGGLAKDGRAFAALEPLCKGRYPQEQYLDYHRMLSETPGDERGEGCRRFAEAHKGQAVRLIALGEYVFCLKDSLDRADAPSARYEELRSLCRTFEAERKGYRSHPDRNIASMVKSFEYMIKTLESKSITLGYEGDTIKVVTRNIRSFSLNLKTDDKKPKSVFNTRMAHPEERFYVRDTFEVILPEISDGAYLVEVRSGDEKRRSEYRKHSLSIALREDADGRSRIYVADSRTGEPVEKVNLELRRSGKQVSKVEDFVLDGFTPLPESFRDTSSDWYFGTIVASAVSRDGFLKTSPGAWINSRNTVVAPERKSVPALNIFTDKAAYRPGETIRYKAVLYLAVAGHAEAMGEGSSVKVLLRDSEGKEVGAARLATNEYGSVAGEFTLPEGLRGGRFRLDVSFSAPGKYGPASASRSIVVDEFVLPDYEITFDSSDELYLAGDTVRVRGSVKSFTGHKVSAASASYEVRDYVRAVRSGTLKLGDDGSFEFSFPSSEKGSVMHYSAFVRVTGATGETIENAKSVVVVPSLNPAVEILNSTGGQARVSYRDRADVITVSGPDARVRISISNPDGMTVNLPVNYSLTDSSGKSIACGTVNSGEPFALSLPASGAYSFIVEAGKKNQRGETITASRELTLLRFDDSAKTLDASFEHVFSLVGSCRDGALEPGEDIHLKIGAGDGPVWMLVELFGDRKQLLEKRLVFLEGVAGSAGSVEDVIFSYKDDYPEGLCLNVFYFRKNRSYEFSRTFVRRRESPVLQMSFTRFVDNALPDADYEISLSAGVGVEAVAAVFDKSSETISPNVWERSMKFVNGVERVFVHSWSGAISGADIPGDDFDREEAVVIAYGKPSRGRKLALKSAAVLEDRAVSAAPSASVVEESDNSGIIVMDYVEESETVETGPVRSDFSTSLAFEPFLRPDDSGNINFSFRTSDKLSTFVVQVYAHDKSMRDTVIRKEFVVSLPVKLSLVQPEYLYRGDRLTLHATLNSLAEKPVGGTVSLSLFDSGDWQSGKPFRKYSKQVTVPAGGALPLSFDLRAAEGDTLGILLSFTAAGAESAGEFSDRLFVTVPVKEDSQVLTESHSAVLLPGMDRDQVLKQLRSSFTGTSSYGAEYSETDIRAMLLDAIPQKVDPGCKDVLSVTESIYVRRVASSLGAEVSGEYSDAELMNMLSSCRNADGGFGWFPGMKSSPVMTAVVLERYSGLDRLGLAPEGFDPEPSVRYLDRAQFLHGPAMPLWCGLLSAEQYMHVRSLFPEFAFEVSYNTSSEEIAFKRNFKEFKSFASAYLVPSEKEGRGLLGMVLQKARRVGTLMNLVSSEQGTALASAWGIRFGASSKLRGSLSADILSLIEYSVRHQSGGWYYPNAVMPLRGLLENELYAHTLLCAIFDDPEVRKIVPEGGLPSPAELSDGIRLWIMLQKETQKWGEDPAFVDAVGTVLRGGDSVLGTRVVSLSKTYREKFESIRSASGGFTIERRFFRQSSPDGILPGNALEGILPGNAPEGALEEITDGAVLRVGDKIVAEYRVSNDENRSFVRLHAPREASLRPVDQLSGNYGWWLAPLRLDGYYSVTPQGYRNVKADCTEFYFDVYPEDKTVVREEFFVTQEGTFKAPVVTIESLYAPHYRANDGFRGSLRSDFCEKVK